MHELQYLTEKDMEYFYKLEERGEAVILRLEPEQLLALDLSELPRGKNDGEAGERLDFDLLREWVQEHGEELRRRYEENEAILRENQWMKATLENDNASDILEEECPGVEKLVVAGGKNTNSRQQLIERLKEVSLDEEQSRIINRAMQRGVDDKVLLAMLREGVSIGEMRRICDAILGSIFSLQ
ncbi:MAG: hypothetical protein LIP11_09340 [Clostridiales bacterium]|nr:hypothetical protein [Clostridiales bacterium]